MAKTKFYGTFGGAFKEGKDYGDIEYHIQAIEKLLTSFSFTMTIETEPVLVSLKKGKTNGKVETK